MDCDCPICLGCGFGSNPNARWRNDQLDILIAAGLQGFDLTCRGCSFLSRVLRKFITEKDQERTKGHVLRIQLVQGAVLKLYAKFYKGLYASECTLDVSLILYAQFSSDALSRLPCAVAYSSCADSPSTFEFLQQSLQTCYSTHQEGLCGPKGPTRLPTRLLKLDELDPLSTRLIKTTATDRGFYAALSYCWGDGLPLKLTAKTKQEFQDGVDWQKLPAVFRNAIKADSLCIDQNSKADWAKESALMDEYYENAAFTISASTSASCDKGFLDYLRNSDCSPKGRFSLELDDSKTIKVIARRMCTRPVEVLETRAWTFQENLLSKRIIDFSSVDIIFRCRELESTMYHQPARWDDYRKQFKEFRDFLSDTSAEQKYEKEDNRLFWLIHWSDMVKVYTKRDITYATDRLPAFGGIAKRFAAKTRFTYVAGLWKELLPEALIWRLQWPTLDPPEGYRVPDEYIAPSWLWASVRGQVTNLIMTDYPPIPLTGGATVIDVDCSPTTESSPFGQVRTGRLVLEGSLSPVIITYDRSALSHPYKISFADEIIRPFAPDSALIYNADLLRRARESDPAAVSFSAPAACILMGAGISDQLPYRWLMVVSRLVTGQYMRLGLIYYQKHRKNIELFAEIDKGSLETVEIV